MLEVIEPLDDESIFGRFLDKKGEGVHHIAVATPRLDEAMAEQAERGNTPVLSGTFGGVELAQLSTDHDLGVIIEIFSGMPSAKPESDAS